VRENRKGVLYSLVYGTPCAAEIDPVEKKPQYHFYPGSTAYSIGTAGCNLHCKFCQNWWMSQSSPEEVPSFSLPPEELVKKAIENKCKSIAYTYNDPIVFYEYTLDTAKLAREKGIKNIFVTNGFINPEPLKELCKYLDAAHVDLKGFTEEYYSNICSARLAPVLETLKILKKEGVWFEVINLVIPTLNDDMTIIRKMCQWLKTNIGADCVLHFSRFFPDYKLQYLPPTPEETLEKAKAVAEKCGLHYVYIGNVFGREDNTYCPKCKKLLIRRSSFYTILENKVKKGKCPYCNEVIAGVFE